jgi:hypothetical protein
MATTTNYGWTTPDDTDLVKDGAAAIRTLGTSIDTSFAADEGDLLVGGTSDIFEALPIGAAGTVLTSDGDTAEWAAPGGSALNYIGGTTFTTSAAVNVNDVFSATYANYLIIGDYVGSAPAGVSLRLRVSGADNTTSNYNSQSIYGAGSTAGAARALNATSMNFIDVSDDPSFCHINVINPFASAKTGIGGYGIYALTEAQNKMCTFNATTSFTGFTIFPSTGTMTGTLRVYGLANS